jgi:formate hydrogenlyase subunit 3/multisubunit Na+/H+ antiporter MnhD subunit
MTSATYLVPPQLAAAAPLLPLVAALLLAAASLARAGRNDHRERVTGAITLAAIGLPFVLLLVLAAQALLLGWPGQVRLGDWFSSGNLHVPLSFTLDGLSLGLGALMSLILLVATRFSVSYLHREPGFHRFFLGMNLFASGLLLLLLAGNAALVFVAWELMGVASWMLISYAYDRPTAARNAERAFLTNRVGDAGLMLGVVLSFLWLGGLDWEEMEASAARLPTLYVSLPVLGFLAAALAKSAQVPFTPWITRALEGPTPSSAVFYGAVMVHAGVFLLARLEPLLIHTAGVSALIVALGALTTLFSWLSGYAQTDVKSALLFSVTAQVGLMFVAIGLGWFELAVWHAALHATWRAWQFLAAPSYLQLLTRPAPPAPAWLTRSPRLYTATLQRFWMEPLTDLLLTQPTQYLAQDFRAIDASVVSRLVGMPEAQRAAELLADRTDVVKGRGLFGSLLAWTADRMNRFEQRLVLQGGGGRVGSGLARLGEWLKLIEDMLEQPRYLLVLIMATIVVIL